MTNKPSKTRRAPKSICEESCIRDVVKEILSERNDFSLSMSGLSGVLPGGGHQSLTSLEIP